MNKYEKNTFMYIYIYIVLKKVVLNKYDKIKDKR